MKLVKTLVNADTKVWLETTTDEEIALALDFGHVPAREFTRRLASADKQVRTTTELGQIGEDHIAQILAEKFPVTNTTKVSKAGDLSLLIEHKKIIVEVKNYTGTVPSGQVEKFQRDLVTAGAAGGVFVSLRTPIAAVTDSFVIRYERIESGSIPCAYLVSDQGPAVILAVNMVTQLMRATAQVQSELYDRDRILGGIHAISSHVDELAKSRNALHVGIGEIFTQLFKLTSGLASGEDAIRSRVDEVKQELFHSTFTGGSSCLESHRWYSGYQANIKKYINDITELIDPDNLVGAWRQSGNRCMHVATGVGFQMYANRVEVILPRVRVSEITVTQMLSMEVSIDKNNISIVLNATSADTIIGFISNC